VIAKVPYGPEGASKHHYNLANAIGCYLAFMEVASLFAPDRFYPHQTDLRDEVLAALKHYHERDVAKKRVVLAAMAVADDRPNARARLRGAIEEMKETN